MPLKVTVLLSFTCNFFAYFKFHSDWRRVIGKIKQNELDSRDTASLNLFTKFSCRAMFDNTWMTEFIHEQQGFIHTMPDSSCVDANTISGRATVHTWETIFVTEQSYAAPILKVDRHISDRLLPIFFAVDVGCVRTTCVAVRTVLDSFSCWHEKLSVILKTSSTLPKNIAQTVAH